MRYGSEEDDCIYVAVIDCSAAAGGFSLPLCYTDYYNLFAFILRVALFSLLPVQLNFAIVLLYYGDCLLLVFADGYVCTYIFVFVCM